METIGNIVVGRPQVRPSAPSHTRGVREGNARTHMIREAGVKRAGRFMAEATERRSTGIDPRRRAPIDPRMPFLTPP